MAGTLKGGRQKYILLNPLVSQQQMFYKATCINGILFKFHLALLSLKA